VIKLVYRRLSERWWEVPDLSAVIGTDTATFLRTLLGPVYDAFQLSAQLTTAFFLGVVFDHTQFTEQVEEELALIFLQNISINDGAAVFDYDGLIDDLNAQGGGVWSGIMVIVQYI